jgi:hypothetical protein
VSPLTGQQKKLLIRALVTAYPSYDELDMLLDLELDKSLAEISPLTRLDVVAHRLVREADAHNWVPDLVTAAELRNPGNEQLRSLIATGQLDLFRVLDRILHQPGDGARDLFPQGRVLDGVPLQQLEQVFNAAAGFQDPVSFAEALIENTARVCRIEVISSASTTLGTGTLVGPELILTNHHVLDALLDGPFDPVGVRFRFDFHMRRDGTVNLGKDYSLAAKWKLAASPPSDVDMEAAPTRLPAADELDYVLVRLGGRPGEDMMPWGKRRGWFDLLRPPPKVRRGLPLLILQHPAGQPAKLSIDPEGVRDLNDNGTRLTYNVNTLGGSSGSPCLTWDLKLVALHHAGSADFSAGRNEGIPITAIVRHLRDAGLEAVLGG